MFAQSHRRARHINPVQFATPATCALYAGGQSYAEGAAVDTWSSRAGLTFSVTAGGVNRPTYRMASFNGQPAVEFDGGANRMNVTSSVNPQTVISVTKADTSSGVRGIFRQESSVIIHRFDSSNFRSYQFSGGFDSQTATTPTNTLICESVFGASLVSQFINGVAGNTDAGTYSTPSSGDVQIGGTTGFTEFFDGLIAVIVTFPTALPTPQQKRIRHSLGYLYKIPCS